jgi:hypothetical protein
MVTAVFASAQYLPGIAAGDAIWANVTMLTLVLGLAAWQTTSAPQPCKDVDPSQFQGPAFCSTCNSSAGMCPVVVYGAELPLSRLRIQPPVNGATGVAWL